ncbi:MAG: type II toxin-antitoxin system RelB/DinJ family antitoxin [Rhizomicrobium sp.]
MTADAIVRARIDTDTKERAAAALGAMGLSISDAIRLLMLRIADEQRLPFAVEVPNTESRKAMKELEAGKGRQARSPAQLFKDLDL